MNIFFLDKNLEKSATYHVDKHIVKMRLELAQLASTAHWLTGTEAPYKPTHKNHPSAIWTRESLSNYNYVIDLGLALCRELEHRYNTKNQKCEHVLVWLKTNQPNIEDTGLTRPKLAMSDDFKIITNDNITDLDWAIENYRNYYKLGKTHLFSWTKRNKPEWI
jgi:hypothetical protein